MILRKKLRKELILNKIYSVIKIQRKVLWNIWFYSNQKLIPRVKTALMQPVSETNPLSRPQEYPLLGDHFKFNKNAVHINNINNLLFKHIFLITYLGNTQDEVLMAVQALSRKDCFETAMPFQ